MLPIMTSIARFATAPTPPCAGAVSRTCWFHFDQVVLAGVRAEKGMASFADKLQPEDTAAIRAYLISRAHEQMQALPPVPTGEDRGADLRDK